MGLASFGFWLLSYQNKIYPGVQVINLNISGLSKEEAAKRLQTLGQDFLTFSSLELDLSNQSTSSAVLNTTLKWQDLAVDFDYSAMVEQAYSVGRSDNWLHNIQTLWSAQTQPVNLVFIIKDYNTNYLDNFVDEAAESFEQPGARPELIFNETTQVFDVFPGEDGFVVDRDLFGKEVESRLTNLDRQPVALTLIEEDHRISENQKNVALTRALALVDKDLTIRVVSKDNALDKTWVLKGHELATFIDLTGGFDIDQIEDYIETLAQGINKPPANASFDFEDGRVTNFVPATNGLEVEVSSNVKSLVTALTQLESGVEVEPLELTISEALPEIATSDVNDLGIKELIGRGYSTYRGSIASRIHNVALTASRLNGILIPPGEEFSFNKAVGEISRATGYQSAYIISGGRTILGDGGGVCQDSTTLFRAVMDAGLPIVERKAHSYRVGYYEQNERPGFDATVYSPSVDLKFKNDTPGHILIQAKADSANTTLVIELYGTDDGRISEITNYRQWDAVPAPPPLYQDDPTLGPGVVKQIDWASPGLKVKFDYIVKRNGETLIEESYYSNYRPWQAVYLKGV